jgi:hypothetical protein
MEHLAHFHTAGEQLFTRSLDLRDDQRQALRRAGRSRCDVRAELNRAPRARRRELDDAEVVTASHVGVESPAEACVEVLRPVDVRDRQDHGLELELSDLHRRSAGRPFAGRLDTAHLGSIVLADTPNARRRRKGRRYGPAVQWK